MTLTKLKLQLLLSNTTQADVARKAGVSPSYICRCVNGEKKPSKRVIEAICDLTAIPESYFVDKNS